MSTRQNELAERFCVPFIISFHSIKTTESRLMKGRPVHSFLDSKSGRCDFAAAKCTNGQPIFPFKINIIYLRCGPATDFRGQFIFSLDSAFVLLSAERIGCIGLHKSSTTDRSMPINSVCIGASVSVCVCVVLMPILSLFCFIVDSKEMDCIQYNQPKKNKKNKSNRREWIAET